MPPPKAVPMKQLGINSLAEYQDKYPKEAAELLRRFSGDLPENFDQLADEFIQTCVQKQKVSPHAKPAKTPSQHLQPHST